MRSTPSSNPARGLILVALAVATALGPVLASSSVSASAGPGTQIVLTDNGSLLIGHPTIFTATIEDISGNTVTTGPDSSVNVTFSQVSGSGAVTGLGTFAAVNGVATDTVTGTVVGPGNFQASATLSTGLTTSTPPLEDDYNAFHGIGVAKSCLSTRLIGQPYECQYKISNNEETAPDTLTITSIVDNVLAFDGTVTSSNLLPSLTLAFTGGASCNMGQTLCTLPFGSTILSADTSFYTIQPDDFKNTNHKLTDTADFTWQDLCDGGSGNCATPNSNLDTAPGSSTVNQYKPSVSTALTPSGPVLVGASVSDQATLTGTSTTPTAGGTVSYAVYSDSGCSSLVTSLGTKTVTSGAVPVSNSWTSTAGNFWFQATYSGDPSNAGPVSSTCSSEPLTVEGPSIGITKLPASQTIVTGGMATWTIVVTNTGNVPLTGVNVTDALAPLCNATFTGTLAVGASETGYSCSLADVTSGFTNVAVATGTPPVGANVTNSASAAVVVDAPSIGITKLPATQSVASGGTATWTIVVTNTGNVPLTGVNVTDALAPLCDATFTGTLAVGASETGYSCSLADVTTGFTNIAVATGTPPVGANVTNSASAVVTVTVSVPPATKLKESVNATIVNSGTLVTFTYKEKNIGKVGITGVTVTGSSCGPATFVSSSNLDSTTLDPGATWIFRCKEVVTNAGTATVTITDTATATGTDAVTGAPAPPETASASVQVRPAVAPCGLLVTVSPNPLLETGQSEVHAVIQVEACPSYAGDTVNIDSSQLAAVCTGTLSFGSLQPGAIVTKNGIEVILDDDGNVTVDVSGTDCAPGTSVIEADLTEAPFLTSLTKLTALPPNISPSGVVGFPADEVETGNTTTSGNSDVYAVFYIETDPVYAEQTVEINSAQLLDRCLGGITWSSNQGTSMGATATATLDDDGNAVITFTGASCAAGPSTVIADVLAGAHTTYTTTYTILAPEPTPS